MICSWFRKLVSHLPTSVLSFEKRVTCREGIESKKNRINGKQLRGFAAYHQVSACLTRSFIDLIRRIANLVLGNEEGPAKINLIDRISTL